MNKTLDDIIPSAVWKKEGIKIEKYVVGLEEVRDLNKERWKASNERSKKAKSRDEQMIELGRRLEIQEFNNFKEEEIQ